MTRQQENYTGIDNLEVMAEARNYNAYLAALIIQNTEAGERVLDFGAGAGTFALPAREAGRNVSCLEPDPTLRQHLATFDLPCAAETRELSDESYDSIYSFNVLEHIEDDGAALSELYRLLAPGGRLLIYVPAFQILFSSMDHKVGHHRRYRRRQLMTRVTESGFDVATCRYVDSLGFFAALLYRLIDRGQGEINRSALALYDRYVFPLSRLLDRLAGRLLGKNVLLLARKPPAASPQY